MPRAFLRKYRWPLILTGTAVLIAVFTLGFLTRSATVTTEVGFGDDLSPLAPSTSQRVIDDKRVARVIFGDVCDGDVTVSVAPLAHDAEGRLRAGLAGWTTSSSTRVYANCTITVNSNERWSDTVLCQIVVHEYGHLAGVEHSTNPRSIMYPRISKQNIPARCPS